jgi:hypothetical protein
MSTLRILALAAAFVGSTTLALAQGPGIAPNGANLPPQQGASSSAPAMGTGHATHHAKKSRHLYNSAKSSKMSKSKSQDTSK